MRDDTTTQPVVFKDLFGKPVVACFDQPDSSSDGGAVLLKACDDRLGLTEAIAACVADARQPGKVIHSFHDLVRQRVFGIACGYEDCNDAERLAEDPMQKLLVDRDPIEGCALASQSTLSRFENALGPKALMRMGNALADSVIARHRKRLKGRVKRITVELDPTDDPTHGAQQLSFFNGHYDTWCYLPVAGFVQFDEEPEQYLFAYLLRPGNADAKLGAIGLLRRILARLRAVFPKARVLVRLDGGFAGPEMFDYLEAERVDYVVAMAGNAEQCVMLLLHLLDAVTYCSISVSAHPAVGAEPSASADGIQSGETYSIFDLEPGSYYISAYLDIDSSGGPPDPDEPLAWYDENGDGIPDPVEISTAGEVVTGKDILLEDSLYLYLPLIVR